MIESEVTELAPVGARENIDLKYENAEKLLFDQEIPQFWKKNPFESTKMTWLDGIPLRSYLSR